VRSRRPRRPQIPEYECAVLAPGFSLQRAIDRRRPIAGALAGSKKFPTTTAWAPPRSRRSGASTYWVRKYSSSVRTVRDVADHAAPG